MSVQKGSSAARLAANRANAQLSTGPRTDEGKMKSAQNARRHGLGAKQVYIPRDRASEFEALRAGYQAELQPIGQLQQDLFDQFVHAAWNLRIARELLAEAFEQNEATAIDRFHRYIGQHERSYHRALKSLRTIQTDRAIRCLPEHQHLETLPDTVNPRPVIREIIASAKRTHTKPSFAAPEPAQQPRAA